MFSQCEYCAYKAISSQKRNTNENFTLPNHLHYNYLVMTTFGKRRTAIGTYV